MTRVWAKNLTATQGNEYVLYKTYDNDDLPDDLEARVQNWANELLCAFIIDDNNTTGRLFNAPPRFAGRRVYPNIAPKR